MSDDLEDDEDSYEEEEEEEGEDWDELERKAEMGWSPLHPT